MNFKNRSIFYLFLLISAVNVSLCMDFGNSSEKSWGKDREDFTENTRPDSDFMKEWRKLAEKCKKNLDLNYKSANSPYNHNSSYILFNLFSGKKVRPYTIETINETNLLCSLLMWENEAADPSIIALIKFAVENGASVDQQTNNHLYPVFLAALHSNYDLVKFLCNHGANVDPTSMPQSEANPLHAAVSNKSGPAEVKKIVEAILNKQSKETKRSLCECQDEHKRTPFDLFDQHKRPELHLIAQLVDPKLFTPNNAIEEK